MKSFLARLFGKKERASVRNDDIVFPHASMLESLRAQTALETRQIFRKRITDKLRENLLSCGLPHKVSLHGVLSYNREDEEAAKAAFQDVLTALKDRGYTVREYTSGAYQIDKVSK